MDKKIKLCDKNNFGEKCPFCDAGIPVKTMIVIWHPDGSYTTMEKEKAIKLGLIEKE